MAGDAPLIVILGPTASGKTGLVIDMAQAINGEIIGADSRQVYRYMDIGTAKPTPRQQAAAPHHLIDVVTPDQSLSLAQYQRLAYKSIDDIHQRGGVPLLVGGTGQYITAVIEGWSIPEVPPNPALRDELEAFATEHGAQALHNRLHQHDPQAAANIDYRNIRRVIRALEVCIESGRPITELQRKQPPPYAIRVIGLTLDRERLYARADQRLDAMMAAGFLDEVRWLLAEGYERRLPAMSGLGYAQLITHLLDNVPLADAVEAAKIATHDFIRRQYTWFRGHNPGILWYDSLQLKTPDIIDAVRQWLEHHV